MGMSNVKLQLSIKLTKFKLNTKIIIKARYLQLLQSKLFFKI